MNKRKMASWGLALLLLLQSGWPLAADRLAEAAAESVREAAAGQNSFSQYARQWNGPLYTGEPLTLSAAEATRSDCNTTASEDGIWLKSDEKQFSEHGWMQWKITAAETAAYFLILEYLPGEDGRSSRPLLQLELDGEVPYNELTGYPLNRLYRDTEAIRRDASDNDRIPAYEEIRRMQSVRLSDTSGLSRGGLFLALQAGPHTIRLSCREGSVQIAALQLSAPEAVLSDAQALAAWKAEGAAETAGAYIEIQAEATYEKSDASLYPQYDRTSPATVPYHPTHIRRNILGGSSWSEVGMWVSYRIDNVSADGLYYLTLKYRQKEAVGTTAFRKITVNGEVPCASYACVAFSYGAGWQRLTVSDESGAPVPLRLKAGENILRIEVSDNRYAEALGMVDEACRELNRQYTQMVMITGANPDPYRDYYLDREIPGLTDAFREQAALLERAADLLETLSGEEGGSESVRDMVRRLRSMAEHPNDIHRRLSAYRDGISSLYTWLDSMTEQPLALDYLILHSADAELPSPHASFWDWILHTLRGFFASFTEDYSMAGETEASEPLTVWVNMGRDQIQVLRNLVTDRFTPVTGIPVRLSLVQTGYVEATLSGSGPDVAIGMARGQPVNLASRHALLPFEDYEEFGKLPGRFADTALVPYQFEGKTYGLPFTQTFFVLFYRSDILEQLDLAVPQTWDEVYQSIPVLQRAHMSVGLPYAAISAASAVDMGLGAKDLYATLLLQNGGSFYREDYTATTLDEEAAVSAFKDWCAFYTQSDFDLVYDFYTRFKTGEMPLGIASFDMANTLMMAAREINGLWGMAVMPGTPQSDGSIDRSGAGAGTANVVFRGAQNPEACFRFLDWWTTADIQSDFCTALEDLLGPGGRYATANLEAFEALSWTAAQRAVIREQRAFVQELPEIPGSYYVSRSIDNAFRAVLYDQKNPREIWEKENRNINREIQRKRNELGLS